MTFEVNSQKKQEVAAWTQQIQETKPPITNQGMDQLLNPGTVEPMAFSSYPRKYDYLRNMRGGPKNNADQH